MGWRIIGETRRLTWEGIFRREGKEKRNSTGWFCYPVMNEGGVGKLVGSDLGEKKRERFNEMIQ